MDVIILTETDLCNHDKFSLRSLFGWKDVHFSLPVVTQRQMATASSLVLKLSVTLRPAYRSGNGYNQPSIDVYILYIL